MPRKPFRSYIAGLVALSAIALATPAAHATGASLDAATDEQKAAAKDKYLAGKAAFDQQQFDEALPLFQESYDVVASPNSHLMIARCLARLGKPLEAFREFQATATEAAEAAQTNDKYEATATSANSESAEVRAQLGTVTVETEGRATVGADDLGPLRSASPAILAPGPVTVRLETPAGQVEQLVEVAAGEDKVVTLKLTPPAAPPADQPAVTPPPPPPGGIDQKVLAYVFGGVGVAGLATFGVFGFLNNQKFDDLQGSCDGSGLCPANLADDGETGRTYQTIANVGLGVGIVGLGTGLALFLTAPSEPDADAAASPGARLAVGPGSVRVDGRF